MADMHQSVKASGDAWDGNPYYANAEKLLNIFWGSDTVFLSMFQELKLDSVVELACGHARHSAQIADRVGKLVALDIHESNVVASKARLKDWNTCNVLKTNGYDLQPIAENSVSAIFCYDAMVHFQPDLVASYILDTARVLQPGGRALYHHSNLADPPGKTYGANPGARNQMSQLQFQRLATAAGLVVLRSCVISWGGVKDLDCVTLLEK